jgi:hypothetical protein
MCKALFTFLFPSFLLAALAINHAHATNIITFSAALLQQTGSITWQVTPQQNISRYEVEKSTDGEVYTYVLAIVANKNLANYTAIDRNILVGKNYYRIKIIQTNGHVLYSNTIVLNNSPKAVVAPSIVSNSLHIWVPVHIFIHTAVIKNALGIICITKHQQINNHNMASINTQHLQKGCYTVQLYYSNGEVSTLAFSKR